MPVSRDVRRAIGSDPSMESFREAADKSGTKTLNDNAVRLVLAGTTTVEELLCIAYRNEQEG